MQRPGAGDPCLFGERQGGQPEAVKARGEPVRAGHRGPGCCLCLCSEWGGATIGF